MKRKQILLCAALLLGAASCRAQPPANSPAPQGGTPLFPGEVRAFKAYGTGPDSSGFGVMPVSGQPFSDALRLTTIKEPPRFYDYGATAPLTAAIHKGDVVWVSLWARRITSRRESGEAQVEVALLQKVGEREVRPLERVISFGPQWTQFTIPFLVRNDSEVGQARLGFRYGYSPQSVEIGGMRLLNFGPNVKLEDLPRTRVRYDGWAANAPWRKAANERIEKHRKGEVTVRVMDAAGKPVPAAKVQVRMKRHAFAWGTAIDDTRINDTKDPDNARYHQTVETYFNKVVIENSLKWGRWIEPKYRDQALASLPWVEARNLPLRGHVMVWPSWQHSPKFLADLKNDPSALKKAVSDHIADQTKTLAGRAAEWDVINETYAHHDIIDILGRDIMVDWFRQARLGAPKSKLFYNDYTMFQKGPGSQYFYDTVKFLKDSGAPIDAIGEQGHFASSPPGIPDVLATLDKFGNLGLPIQISEFDIDTDDPGLQTDFMRDFMTAVFSHPSVMGVMQWGFWEKSHWLPRAALWDANWNLRPHGQVYVDLTTKTWWTNADGATKKDGIYKTRAFYGDYEVTVTQGDKSRTQKFTLTPTTTVLRVNLP
ncbi:MAG: endo-1,4-beta-xylanase [Armatimonadota bacterium]